MTTVELPYLVIAAPPAAQLDVVALERALRERVDGEVRFDAGTRAVYSTDASNFRQVPIGVVVPAERRKRPWRRSRCAAQLRRADRVARRRHQPRRPVHQHARW